MKTVTRAGRGAAAHAAGLRAETAASAALMRDGWQILAQRVRTPSGEIDLVAERDGLVAMIEVKCRPDLATAAHALSARQQARLLAAAEYLLGEHPAWGEAGVRFDVMLVDAQGRVRRITDAIRQMDF